VTPEEPDDPHIERPMHLHGHQAAFAGGLTAAVAAMQGWFNVQASGRGVLLDIAVLDALASMPLISQAAVFAGHPPPRGPSRRPLTVPRGFLRCREGYVYTQGGDDNWTGWARLLERPDWQSGPMAEPSNREAHWAELVPVIQAWLDLHPNTEVYRALQGEGITAFPVNAVGQVVEHPQTRARGVVQRIERAGTDDGFLAPRTAVRVRDDLAEIHPDILQPLGADSDTFREALHA
jgi:crotonobetainyl-CoA:carnitine CoA-transferase CaiB-like acyl-CoA transferase